MSNFRRRVFLSMAAAAPLAGLAWPAWADEISVTQYGVSLYGLPFTVAKDQGLFQKAGIDITGFIGSAGGGTTVRNVLASATPYGDVAVGAALAAWQHGLDLIIVNTGTRSVAEASIVTLPGSPVQSLHDLVGQKVAVTSPKGVSEMLFLLALQAQKIAPDSIKRIYSGGYGAGLTLLDQGVVAGAALIEPLSIMRKDRYRTIAAYRDILPPMTSSVGITTREFAASQPAKLRAIIAGRRAGVQSIYADPHAAGVLAAKDYDLAPAIAQEAVANMIGPHMWSEGNFNQTELNRMVDALRLIGQVQGQIDWSKLLDKRFLPADLQSAG